MSKKKMVKHIIYYELLEAMGEDGCPICRLSHSASSRYIASILNEGVNDSILRRKLRESLGFCGGHAGELRKMGDSLATAILCKDLVDVLRDDMGLRPDTLKECPACVSYADAEKGYLSIFYRYLGQEEFLNKYDASFGLCFFHLAAALKATGDAASRDIIFRKEADKLKKLSEQLAEFIRKKDYRYSHEDYGDERDSWLRALEKISGRRR